MAGEGKKCIQVAFRSPALDNNVRGEGKKEKFMRSSVRAAWQKVSIVGGCSFVPGHLDPK